MFVPKKRKRNKKRWNKNKSKGFFKSDEWKRLRYQVLKRDGGRCQACGRSAKDGVILCVDHIKPRHQYPHLALDPNNLQTLCGGCNMGKGAKDETDWRPKPDEIAAELDMQMIADLRERGLLN